MWNVQTHVLFSEFYLLQDDWLETLPLVWSDQKSGQVSRRKRQTWRFNHYQTHTTSLFSIISQVLWGWSWLLKYPAQPMSQSLTLWDRYPQCGYHMLIMLSHIQTIHLPATNQLPSKLGFPSLQWPFQEPKVEVPTIYKAYIRPM